MPQALQLAACQAASCSRASARPSCQVSLRYLLRQWLLLRWVLGVSVAAMPSGFIRQGFGQTFVPGKLSRRWLLDAASAAPGDWCCSSRCGQNTQ